MDWDAKKQIIFILIELQSTQQTNIVSLLLRIPVNDAEVLIVHYH